MDKPLYLNTEIKERKSKPIDPRPYMTVYGYTKRSGAPTSNMIRLKGEHIWRRVMVWCFSNVGTLFIRSKGKYYIVREYELNAVPLQGENDV